MATVALTVEMSRRLDLVTSVRTGLPNALIATARSFSSSQNLLTPAMHAGTLAARLLTVLGVTPPTVKYDGSIVTCQSAGPVSCVIVRDHL